MTYLKTDQSATSIVFCMYNKAKFNQIVTYTLFIGVERSAVMSAAESGFGGVLSSSTERYPTSSSLGASYTAPSKKQRRRKPKKQRKPSSKRQKKTGPKKTIKKKTKRTSKKRLFVKSKAARKSQPKLFL